MEALTHIEVFIGGAPLLEVKLAEGLLQLGRAHPQWRFSLRGADFRYSAAWLRQHRVAGALVIIDASHVERVLTQAGVPWVHLLPPRDVDHPAVGVDDDAIGRMGANKLLDLGFTRFAFCGVKTFWSDTRGRGFVDRIAEAGYECGRFELPFERLERWTLDPEAESKLAGWVAGLEHRTAIMAAHDVAAARLVDACREGAIRIPDEVSILGVGNHQLLCELSPVPISSIDCAVPEVATKGGKLLQALMENRPAESSILVPPRALVERRSTDVLVYDDALVCRMVEHIRDHVCDGLTANDLSAAFRMSRRTLARRFAESVGRTPAAEIRRARFQHAQRMLTRTDMPLTDIAMACGYADLSHMDRSFHHALGMSPGAVRRRQHAC